MYYYLVRNNKDRTRTICITTESMVDDERVLEIARSKPSGWTDEEFADSKVFPILKQDYMIFGYHPEHASIALSDEILWKLQKKIGKRPDDYDIEVYLKRLAREDLDEPSVQKKAFSPRRPDERGGIAMMPLKKNVPDGKEGWTLVTCPKCQRECWETPLLRAMKDRIQGAYCTECAVKASLADSV